MVSSVLMSIWSALVVLLGCSFARDLAVVEAFVRTARTSSAHRLSTEVDKKFAWTESHFPRRWHHHTRCQAYRNGNQRSYFQSNNHLRKKQYMMTRDVQRWIHSGHPEAVERAEDLVQRIQATSSQYDDDDEYQTSLRQAYNLYILSLARSDLPRKGDLAEEVLSEMAENGISPDQKSYATVMDAHAKSHNPKRAQQLLMELLSKEADNYDGPAGVSSVVLDTMLNAWAQQGDLEGAQQAQFLLDSIHAQAPDRVSHISYSTVMNAWAKLGTTEAAEQAESMLYAILDRYCTKQNHTAAPTSTNTYSTSIQPDTFMVNIAINAWATCQTTEAAKRALQLLENVRDQWDDRVTPTEEQGGEHAVCCYGPDLVSYNTVLSAWSRSGDPSAGRWAEKIVQDMTTQYQERGNDSDGSTAVEPTTMTYNNVLNAWSKTSTKTKMAAPRAQAILDFMIQSERESIAPDVTSFVTVMDSWAKSKQRGKAKKCRDLLDNLLALYASSWSSKTLSVSALKPTSIPYNTVLNACAFSSRGTSKKEQRESLQIAVSTFSEISKGGMVANATRIAVAPDTVTYGNMIKCLANLMPAGDMRSKMAVQLFQRCCTDGLVGSLVWQEVRRAVPSSVLEQIVLPRLADNHRSSPNKKIAIGQVQMYQLPREWRKATHRKDNAGVARRPKRRSSSKKQRADDGYQSGSFIVETQAQSDKDML